MNIATIVVLAASAWHTPAHARILSVHEGCEQMTASVVRNPDAGNTREFDYTRGPRRYRLVATYAPWNRMFYNMLEQHSLTIRYAVS